MDEIDDYINDVPKQPKEPETLIVKLVDGMVPVTYNEGDTVGMQQQRSKQIIKHGIIMQTHHKQGKKIKVNGQM